MGLNRTVRLFEERFRKQAAEGGSALNPFEELALPYLRGSVLDLGCGLGNLSLEAAPCGSTVKRFATVVAQKP